jgi:hypothetical protein
MALPHAAPKASKQNTERRSRSQSWRQRLNTLLINVEYRQPEPAAAGEASLFGFCLESGEILRFSASSPKDDQRTCSANGSAVR